MKLSNLEKISLAGLCLLSFGIQAKATVLSTNLCGNYLPNHNDSDKKCKSYSGDTFGYYLVPVWNHRPGLEKTQKSEILILHDFGKGGIYWATELGRASSQTEAESICKQYSLALPSKAQIELAIKHDINDMTVFGDSWSSSQDDTKIESSNAFYDLYGSNNLKNLVTATDVVVRLKKQLPEEIPATSTTSRHPVTEIEKLQWLTMAQWLAKDPNSKNLSNSPQVNCVSETPIAQDQIVFELGPETREQQLAEYRNLELTHGDIAKEACAANFNSSAATAVQLALTIKDAKQQIDAIVNSLSGGNQQIADVCKNATELSSSAIASAEKFADGPWSVGGYSNGDCYGNYPSMYDFSAGIKKDFTDLSAQLASCSSKAATDWQSGQAQLGHDLKAAVEMVVYWGGYDPGLQDELKAYYAAQLGAH